MSSIDSGIENLPLPVEVNKGVIGVQGEQGQDKYYYVSTGCTGITHTVESSSVTNIYNYLCGTGICPNVPGNPVSAYVPIPTEAYASGYFDHTHNGYQIQVTQDGYTVPLYCDWYQYRNIVPIGNASGETVQLQLREHGYYEVSYQVYLKEPAEIGARIRIDTALENALVMSPDGLVSQLSAASILSGNPNQLISLELFANTDLPVTLKGIIGASLTIKRLA